MRRARFFVQLLRITKNKDGSDADFYRVVGSTSFGNEYEFEFAKELVLYEKCRPAGPATRPACDQPLAPTTSSAMP